MKKYILQFKKGQMPPVNGFWSLTMYDGDRFFVPNSLNRHRLSQRDKLVANDDGSVDIYLQADSPGKDKEANWLPAPKAKFSAMLRMYWPKDGPVSILNGCPSSKPNPHEFIGGLDLLAIAYIHGGADKRSGPGRPKRTPKPHRAGAGIDRAAPSNCSAEAQPNSPALLPLLGSGVLELPIALVAAMA